MTLHPTIIVQSGEEVKLEESRPPNLHKFQSMRTKEAIPSIDIMSQMWLGFPIHEVVAVQRGGGIIREHRTNKHIARMGPHQEKSSTSSLSGEHSHVFHNFSIQERDRTRHPVTTSILPNSIDKKDLIL